MIHPYFKKYPFMYKYFSVLLENVKNNNRKFPQAIIFEGQDIESQYILTLELARNLNCADYEDENCQCTNCKWIKTYCHPAIQNVSQIHFKPNDDDTKTTISVKQTKQIESSLMLSSDYHRFFIFFSSKELDNDEISLDKYGYNPVNHTLEPLDFKVFNSQSANILLKSIEEPPENTTFVFLTNSKSQILQTIASRCQIFKLEGNIQNIDYNDITELINPYPVTDYKSALEISEKILNHIKETYDTPENTLNKFIAYLKDLIIKNPDYYNKIQSDIMHVSNTIKHIRANVNDKNAIESLFLKITKG